MLAVIQEKDLCLLIDQDQETQEIPLLSLKIQIEEDLLQNPPLNTQEEKRKNSLLYMLEDFNPISKRITLNKNSLNVEKLIE